MRLLYCDESNLNETDYDFFVYGGIVIDCAVAAALSSTIERIRVDAGIPPDFILKFNPSPANLNHQQFVEVKRDVIQAAVDHGCNFLTSLILHNVSTSPDVARRNEVNRVSYHFNLELGRLGDHGIVLIDQFTDTQINHHLRDKFLFGLRNMPYGPPTMRLSRILGFHYGAIGQSHFGSLIDIVIGSFRFAVNAHTRNQTGNMTTATQILNQLSPLFLRVGSGQVSENSLFFSPKVITYYLYRQRYEQLKAYLAQNGIEAEQPITNQRMY